MSYSSEVLADSPLLYLKLDETSGSVAADSSGSSRDGAYGGFNSLGVSSLLADGSGHALGLTADTSNGVSVTSASWMNVSALSAEALVNFSSSPDGSNGDAIVCRYGAGGFQWLVWRNTSGKLALQLNLPGGSGVVNVADTATVTLGSTYHVVATWDGTTAKLYVGNSLVGSAGATGSLAASTQDLSVGAYSNSVSTVPGAVVDEVSFYGAALSSGRVSAHYTAATSASPDATVAPPAATATAAARVPVVSASRVVLPPAATATAAALPPTIGAGGNATVSPPAATATATALAPTITQVIPAGTDTSNSLNGRRRRARASVVVTRPAAATPSRAAVKYDKSVPYPPPTLVNGRPT